MESKAAIQPSRPDRLPVLDFSILEATRRVYDNSVRIHQDGGSGEER
jgi:hypothetical protein